MKLGEDKKRTTLKTWSKDRRTEECRILNVEGWNRFAQAFYKKDGAQRHNHFRHFRAF
jgi:hypothetical protein